MRANFSPVVAPLISTVLFMLGNGYLTSFISIKMNEIGHSEQTIGIVSSAYYIGLVIGALQIAKLIVRMGHLRIFATFIGLFNCVCLFHIISDNVYLWFVLRLLAGVSLAGFYVTIESWLLECSNNKNRGTTLALYMVAISSSQAFGQLFLDNYTFSSILPFVVVTILLSLSVIPVAISNNKIAKKHDIELIHVRSLTKVASSSIAACFVSGLFLSTIYSLLPLVFEKVTGNTAQTAYLMFVTLFGGMILQYPIGLLSDNFDRRKVVIGISTALVILLFIMVSVGHENLSFTQLTIIYFIFGGMSFTFYPVALSMVCDILKSSHIVSATQCLSMVEGIGSILGPIIAPPFMLFFGAKGLSIYFIITATCLTSFLIYRTLKRERISHNNFFVAVHTTPVAAELDPRGEEEK